MTDQARVSRWSRRFVGVGALFLLAWAIAATLGLGRRTEVALAVFGFVYHTVFGKAYALVPTYFDRDLASAWAPVVQFPLTVVAAGALAASTLSGVPAVATQVGAVAWAAGVLVFLGAMGWTLRGNLTGAETGTGEHNAHRRWVDRFANAFVPVVLLYVAAGSYELLAGAVGLPTLLGGAAPRVSHLLAAGGGALLVFAVGFRLLPRFLVTTPPRSLVALVLPAGAIGPALVASGLYDGTVLAAGAAFEGVALGGYAAAYAVMFADSERRRVGVYAVALGALAAVAVAAIGTDFALGGRTPTLIAAHYRLALVGFLGLTIVGATYQFYPPAVGAWPRSDDRTALAAIGLLAAGLALQPVGVVVGPAARIGAALALAGAAIHAYLLLSAFRAR